MELVDLSNSRSFANGFPHDFFTWLRRNAPVWWHEPTRYTPNGVGFWVVSRYEDVVAVFKDPETYSSELGGTQIYDGRGMGYQLNQTDDPKHRRLRALVNKGFTPRMIGRLEDELRRRTKSILDAVPAAETFNFVPAVARELPLQAICSVLGVPQEDRAAIIEIVDLAVGAGDGTVMSPQYLKQLSAYANTVVERKRSNPADDILSVIVHAQLDDGSPQLNNQELRAFFNLLFPAGAETTRGSIAGGLLALMENPEELERLRDDPQLMKTAIEEMVRWTSPSVYKRRTTTREADLKGRLIRQGQKVTVWEMSANRDEDAFENPFRFDVGRDPNNHVGFGLGTHFCLGANLARLEIRVMFEELLERYERFEVTGPLAWTNNNRLLSLTQLPLRVFPFGT
ncbi:MAG TPA: cytochrome P450 [Candidatus Binataceae bacterium]|jgi:cytochrome P450|nr:cytochrome P450 [Candidatus Binataceae bacterium]